MLLIVLKNIYQKKLDILQYNYALRISLGAMKTSPTNALLAEAGEIILEELS